MQKTGRGLAQPITFSKSHRPARPGPAHVIASEGPGRPMTLAVSPGRPAISVGRPANLTTGPTCYPVLQEARIRGDVFFLCFPFIVFRLISRFGFLGPVVSGP